MTHPAEAIARNPRENKAILIPPRRSGGQKVGGSNPPTPIDVSLGESRQKRKTPGTHTQPSACGYQGRGGRVTTFTPPVVRRWAPKNLAVCYVDRKRVYLGPWGSAAAATKYQQVVLRLKAEHDRARAFADAGEPLQQPVLGIPKTPATRNQFGAAVLAVLLGADTTAAADMAEIGARFVAFARTSYLRDGKPTGTLPAIERAWTIFASSAFAGIPPGEFQPMHLIGFRTWLCADADSTWNITTINQYTRWIVRGVKWGVSRGLVPASVWQALESVEPLRRGRPVEGLLVPPRPPRKRMPTTREQLQKVRRVLPPVVRAMLDVQLLCGARPEEVCEMHAAGIVRGKRGVCVYKPSHHKTEHEGIDREIFLGPRAQRVLRWLHGEKWLSAQGYLFSPAAGEAARHARRRASRTTPKWPSHDPATRRARRLIAGEIDATKISVTTTGRAGARYTPDSYRRAIERACDEAGVERFTPYQLRHRAATDIAERESLETAMATLGHTDVKTTLGYARPARRKAIDAASRRG
jgi:integrase